MPGSWTVEIQGRKHTITVQQGAQEKDVIRVNGTVAAKPLGPEETDRTIIVGQRYYRVVRSGEESFDLVKLDDAPFINASVESQRLASAGGGSRWIPIIGWSAIAVVVASMLIWAMGPGYSKQAKERVELVMSEMKQGTGPEAVLAVTIWAKNRRSLDSMEMNWASDHFDKWRREKGLYRKFDSYEILDSEEIEGEKVPTAIVTLVIEGQQYRVRVPKDLPISWEP